MKKRGLKRIRGVVLFCAAFLSLGRFPAGAQLLASGTQSYRNQVVNVCGITDISALEEPCTRREFARMVVMASTQKDLAGSAPIAASPDVPGSDAYAKYVRIALRNGWMRTKLGGNFDPDGTVTLSEAAKAAMALLGYTDSDFSGNVNEQRLAKFCATGLNEGVGGQGMYDPLTRQEAVNVIYNTLKASPKNGNGIYGTCIGLSLASDGELNATGILDDSMKGPVLIKTYNELKTLLPFDIDTANCYYNGTRTSYYTNLQLLSYSSQLSNFGWLILYYNEASQTVWAYGADSGDTAYHCVRGTVNAIYYDSDNIVSPTSVLLEDTIYPLSGSDIKFLFSVNGTIGVGDEVVLICKSNVEGTSIEGEGVVNYYATGAVLYRKKGEK